MKNIVIGHDNANPGAGWFLEKVMTQVLVKPNDNSKPNDNVKPNEMIILNQMK